MSNWNYEALQDAINRTKPVDASDGMATRKLYDVISGMSHRDESFFHDAVSKNLKLGRFLLLIVGDGIREGMESMTRFLQQYAGFHFTLALVEVALFEVTEACYIAQPRVLAKTINIDRGIVVRNAAGEYDLLPPDAAGWHVSPNTGIQFQPVGGKLRARVGTDDATAADLPKR